MKKRIIAIALSMAVTFTTALGAVSVPVVGQEKAAGETRFYVSLTGNDSNPGSKERPFQTLEHARQEVAKINADMSGDIVVYLMDGTYYLNDTLELTEGDSGSNGYQVRYEAYGDSAVISGGVSLNNGWTVHDAEENIYKTTVPKGLNFRQLYVNDEKAVRARTGKPGILDSDSRILGADRLDENGKVIPEWWSNGGVETKVPAAGGDVIIKDDGTISQDMGNFDQVELHIFTGWCDNALRIDSIENIGHYDCQTAGKHWNGKEVTWDGDALKITLQNPEAERIFNRPHPNLDNYTGGPHFVFYVENAYELIDEDGEWYLDTRKNTLYYKAPAGMDMNSAEVVAPVLENVISIKGTLDNPVHDIQFKGLTIEHSTWLTASEEGLVGGQACQYVNYAVYATNDVGVKGAEAGIRVENTKDLRFDGNHIRFMGGAGIDLCSGTENTVLINNEIEEIAGNGIEIGKFAVDENTDYHVVYNPEDEREVCRQDKILNNKIHTIGTQYEGAVGLGAGYVQSIIIANNTIYDCPYSGISVGYGWTAKENPMKNNVIYRNEVHHINQVVCDGGAIYTLSNQSPGSSMRENYLHDNLLPEGADYSADAIYLDEQTTGYIVDRNVMVASYSIRQNQASNTFGTNYQFNGYSSDSGYAEFATDTVQKIMAQAGVQSDFSEEELFGPEISSAEYEAEYGTLTIVGSDFGSNSESVVFKTRQGEVKATDVLAWSDEEVVVKAPANVRNGDKVWVYTAEGKKSKSVVISKPQVEYREIMNEDFDGKQAGALASNEWSVSVPSKAMIVEEGDGKVLELKGNNPNLEVTWMDGKGNNWAFGENVLTFDFQIKDTLTNYEGFYNLLRQDKNGTKYTLDIRPAHVPLAIEQKGKDEVQKKDVPIQTGTWYSCKTMVLGEWIYLSVWERNGAEPQKWMLRKRMENASGTDNYLNFSYYAENGQRIYVDNIKVDGLSLTYIQPVEADELQAKIQEAEELAKNSASAELKQAIADAKALLNEDVITQEQVDAMLGKLTAAIEEAEKESSEIGSKEDPPSPKKTSIKGTALYEKTYGDKAFFLDASCSEAKDGKLSYESDNTSAASVSADGKVTVKSTGTAVIIVKLVSDTHTADAYKVTVQVKPSKVRLSSVKSKKKKQVTVTWKKLAAGQKISGYQIACSTNKNFKSDKKVSAKAKLKSTTVKKLKSGKKYYIRVRAYKTVGKTRLYGAWSGKKAVKVK